MTDRTRRALARVNDHASWLARHALEDLAAAAWPSAGDGPHVTSSAVSSPTETAGIHDRLARAGDHQLATRVLEQAAELLERGRERMTPYEATGEGCPTVARDPESGEMVSCTGTVTHFRTGRGLCESCDEWLAKPQHRGLSMPVDVLKARNGRRPRWCACGPECCPRDEKGHTSCTDRAEEGRTVSRRCRQAQQRARERQRVLADPHPWRWQEPA